MKKFKLDLQYFATDVNTLTNGGAGYNQISNENAEIYDRELYDRLAPELQWFKYGEKKKLPKRSGDKVSIRRFESLDTSTTEITEGVVPDGANLTVVKRSVTVKEYGNYVKTTERLNTVGLDDTTSELVELLGENAGQSIDEIVRDVVNAGSNVMYANKVTTRATVASNITYDDIKRMARTMKVNKVKKITMPDGDKGFICFVDPYVAFDIKGLDEYKEFNKYQNSKTLKDGVIAKLAGIYFVEIDNGKIFAGAGSGGADVHSTICIGKNAYMVPDVEGSSKPKTIIKPAGSAGHNDPLDQISSVGWKALFGTLRIDELCTLRYESKATE